VHTAYKIVTTSFNVHRIGEHDEQNMLDSQLLPAKRSHPDLPGPVTNVQNNALNISDYDQLKS
jgi:hypothetical protein